MLTLEEYHIEIKPVNIAHWEGLCNLVVEEKDMKDKY